MLFVWASYKKEWIARFKVEASFRVQSFLQLCMKSLQGQSMVSGDFFPPSSFRLQIQFAPSHCSDLQMELLDFTKC